MSDAELIDRLELAFRGVASCATCGCCRGVAEMMLQVIAEHRSEPVYDVDEFPGPPACVGGQCGEE